MGVPRPTPQDPFFCVKLIGGHPHPSRVLCDRVGILISSGNLEFRQITLNLAIQHPHAQHPHPLRNPPPPTC